MATKNWGWADSLKQAAAINSHRSPFTVDAPERTAWPDTFSKGASAIELQVKSSKLAPIPSSRKRQPEDLAALSPVLKFFRQSPDDSADAARAAKRVVADSGAAPSGRFFRALAEEFPTVAAPATRAYSKTRPPHLESIASLLNLHEIQSTGLRASTGNSPASPTRASPSRASPESSPQLDFDLNLSLASPASPASPASSGAQDSLSNHLQIGWREGSAGQSGESSRAAAEAGCGESAERESELAGWLHLLAETASPKGGSGDSLRSAKSASKKSKVNEALRLLASTKC